MSTNEKPSPDLEKKTASKNQGEGDYESARKFDDDARRFLESADVPDLARRAAPGSKEEAAELKKAEEIGRSHAKGKPAGKPESPKAGH